MMALAFLKKGGWDISAAYFNHGTDHGAVAEKFLTQYCRGKNINLLKGAILSDEGPRRKSQEEYWRDERYKFLDKIIGQIVTAHHLDDAVETWIFSSLNGCGKIIPVRRGPNISRPFLFTAKEDVKCWVQNNEVPFISDPSNDDLKYMRNRIRKKIVPEALLVNPGLRTVVRKMYISPF